MFDKLYLNCGSENVFVDGLDEFLAENQLGYVEKADSYYRHALVFRRTSSNDHVAVLKTQPRFSSANAVRIEINPSRFKSFSEMNRIVSGITDEPLKISRLDLCVDVDRSVEDVYKALLIQRKRSRKLHMQFDYKNMTEIKGCYLGSRPEIIVVYERDVDRQTRIEIRMEKDRVPITEYSRLREYCDLNPFDAFSFVKVSAPTDSFQDRSIADAIAAEFESHGAMVAKSRINQQHHSNFHRAYTKYLAPDDSFPDLFEAHRDSLDRFFKGGGEQTA